MEEESGLHRFDLIRSFDPAQDLDCALGVAQVHALEDIELGAARCRIVVHPADLTVLELELWEELTGRALHAPEGGCEAGMAIVSHR